MHDEDLVYARQMVDRLKQRRPTLLPRLQAQAFAAALERLIYRIEVLEHLKNSLKLWLDVE